MKNFAAKKITIAVALVHLSLHVTDAAYLRGRIARVSERDLSNTIGGCSGTEYGCCSDSVTSKNADGSNCPQNDLIGGCAGTQYGCCSDGVTSKNANGSNCPQNDLIGGCAGTEYGCCSDGVTSKNADGSNCPNPTPTPTPTSTPTPLPGGCPGTEYGCCSDGVTPKNSDSSNCPTLYSLNFGAGSSGASLTGISTGCADSDSLTIVSGATWGPNPVEEPSCNLEIDFFIYDLTYNSVEPALVDPFNADTAVWADSLGKSMENVSNDGLSFMAKFQDVVLSFDDGTRCTIGALAFAYTLQVDGETPAIWWTLYEIGESLSTGAILVPCTPEDGGSDLSVQFLGDPSYQKQTIDFVVELQQ
jgi:hypothetical protein